MFRIKSANSDARLDFTAREGEWFTVSVDTVDHTARQRVTAYTDEAGIARLFRDAASEWRGWPGKKTWKSIEGQLELSLASDKLGHVTLEVIMSNDFGGPDPWILRTSLGLEAGQLEQLAREAEAFFA